MSVRQYIGARYVPKFYEFNNGVWQNNTEYEPLTIVQYNSNSYTSKKTVPANIGNPSENPDYWVVTGNYNAQVEAYRAEVAKLKQVGTPEMYGAAGDGIEDDTIALQDCFNNCDIAILSNLYLISDSLTIPKGVKIIGTGGIIKTTSYRGNLLVLSGDNEIVGLKFTDTLDVDVADGACIYGNGVSNVLIEYCTFGTVGEGTCILFDHSSHINVKHNTFENYNFAGVMLMATCKYVDIDYNYLENSRHNTANHSYPICISAYQKVEYGPAENIRVSYNTIIEHEAKWEGIDSHGALNYEISHNYIYGCLSGISCGDKPTSLETVFVNANSYSLISDNYIHIATGDPNLFPYGIAVSANASCTINSLVIDSNNVTVESANTSTTAAMSGIALRKAGKAENVRISNNKLNVKNCHGVSLEGAMFESVDISGNYFEDVVSVGDVWYCINLKGMDDYNNIHVVNNSVKSGVTSRFFAGSLSAPTSDMLVEFDNDYKGLDLFHSVYTTAPAGSLVEKTKAKGIIGQFIPSTNVDTVAGWYCKAANNWIEVSGTSV